MVNIIEWAIKYRTKELSIAEKKYKIEYILVFLVEGGCLEAGRYQLFVVASVILLSS